MYICIVALVNELIKLLHIECSVKQCYNTSIRFPEKEKNLFGTPSFMLTLQQSSDKC